MISSSQIKAARSLLSWSMQKLSDKADVSLITIKRYEASGGIPEGKVAQLMKIKNALEAAGIEFLGDPIESPGVRLRLKP